MVLLVWYAQCLSCIVCCYVFFSKCRTNIIVHAMCKRSFFWGCSEASFMLCSFAIKSQTGVGWSLLQPCCVNNTKGYLGVLSQYTFNGIYFQRLVIIVPWIAQDPLDTLHICLVNIWQMWNLPVAFIKDFIKDWHFTDDESQ